MTKVMIVDVGTHEAQEFQALFVHGWRQYFHHWLKHLNRVRRAGGTAISRARYGRLLEDARWLRAHRADVRYVLVEPNARLFALPIYRQADLAFNIALSTDPQTASLMKLYFATNDKMGQGSSLFVEKPNVDTSDFDWVFNVDAQRFVQELSRTVAADVSVLLRLNNEGAEVEVIQAFHQVFGPRLRGVMGSLSDVEKVKGPEALQNLHQYLETAQVPFVPLHSNFVTWPDALAFVRSMVETPPGA